MKQAWAGRPFSHDGRFYRARDYTISPLPPQKPHPPLLVGCTKRRMCNLAGREADIVSLMVDLSDRSLGDDPYAGLATSLDWVREGAGATFGRLELKSAPLLGRHGRHRARSAEAADAPVPARRHRG